MATTSQVARAVSAAFRIPVETVQMHIRLLREAEKITVTGRGRSVSQLDLHHVSVTLIACITTPVVKNGPTEAEAFGSLFSSTEWDINIKPTSKIANAELPLTKTFQSAYFINFLASILADILSQIDRGSQNENRQEYEVLPQSITLERAVFVDREKIERRAFARVAIGRSQHISRFFHQSDPIFLTPARSSALEIPWVGSSQEPIINTSQTIYYHSLFALISHLHAEEAI